MGWFANTYEPLRAGNVNGTLGRIHDAGLVRASRFKCHHRSGVTGVTENTLFVGRLGPKVTKDQVVSLFEPFGKLANVSLPTHVITGVMMGYAFVEFAHHSDCVKAYDKCKFLEIHGRHIIVDYVRAGLMDGWVPRRFGGGLSGRKQSGQMRFGGRYDPFRFPRYA